VRRAAAQAQYGCQPAEDVWGERLKWCCFASLDVQVTTRVRVLKLKRIKPLIRIKGRWIMADRILLASYLSSAVNPFSNQTGVISCRPGVLLDGSNPARAELQALRPVLVEQDAPCAHLLSSAQACHG